MQGIYLQFLLNAEKESAEAASSVARSSLAFKIQNASV